MLDDNEKQNEYFHLTKESNRHSCQKLVKINVVENFDVRFLLTVFYNNCKYKKMHFMEISSESKREIILLTNLNLPPYYPIIYSENVCVQVYIIR